MNMQNKQSKKWLALHQKAEALSESLYPTIGEFAVAFEALCHALKMGIGDILEKNGLREAKLTDILIGDLTIFPLQSIYHSLLAETQQLDSLEERILDNIFKRISQLGEQRNRIIHSAWFIDYKNPEDISKGLLTQYRPGPSKRGAKESPSKFPIHAIKEITGQARILDDLVHQVNMCIYTGTTIGSRFSVDSEGNVVAKGSIMDFFQRDRKGVSYTPD
jgi:hypothetical protein